MRERPSTVNRSVRLSHKQNRKVAAADFRDASRSLSEPPTGTAIVRNDSNEPIKNPFACKWERFVLVGMCTRDTYSSDVSESETGHIKTHYHINITAAASKGAPGV